MKFNTGLKIAVVLCVVAWYLNDPVPEGFSAPWKLRSQMSIRKLLISVLELTDQLGIYPFANSYRALASNDQALDIPQHMMVENDEFDGVKVRIYKPRAAFSDGQNRPAMVYFHGGGWIQGRPKDYDRMMFDIVTEIDIIIISVDYRLAPEVKFPGPFDDCVKVTKHFLSNVQTFGVDSQRVAIGGDSAGGNLAAAVSLKLRDENFQPMPARQILIYPAVQAMDFALPSYIQNRHGPMLRRRLATKMWSLYAVGSMKYASAMLNSGHTPWSVKQRHYNEFINHDDLPADVRYEPYEKPNMKDGDEVTWKDIKEVFENPYFAPLMAPDVSNTPPAYVYTAQYDMLRDEGLLYVKRLREAGVAVNHVHKKNAFHGMCSFSRVYIEGRECVEEVVKFLKHL